MWEREERLHAIVLADAFMDVRKNGRREVERKRERARAGKCGAGIKLETCFDSFMNLYHCDCHLQLGCAEE